MAPSPLDKFSIVNTISQNVFYSLHEAVDRETKEPVFLKLIDTRFSSNKDGLLRIFIANAILNATACPNICKLHGFGKERHRFYIATEHVDTDNCFALNQENASVSYDSLFEILTKIAMTLRHAHLHGVTHGLLAPDCIYIAPDLTIKIDGFGFHFLVPQLVEERAQIDENLKLYIAPEVFKQTTEIDGRADIYSMSMIIFHILSGHLPFFSNNFLESKDHRSLVSAAENLFSKTLQIDPKHRLQNLKDFMKELKSLDWLFSATDDYAVGKINLESWSFNSDDQTLSEERTSSPPTSSPQMQRILSSFLAQDKNPNLIKIYKEVTMTKQH